MTRVTGAFISFFASHAPYRVVIFFLWMIVMFSPSFRAMGPPVVIVHWLACLPTTMGIVVELTSVMFSVLLSPNGNDISPALGGLKPSKIGSFCRGYL